MGCVNNESDFVKTVEIDILDYGTQPQYRICVYRLAANPERFVVRVIGPAETVEVVGSFGVVRYWVELMQYDVPVPSDPVSCSGIVRTETLTVTELGVLTLQCPVSRVIRARGRIYGYNGDCQSNGEMLSVPADVRATAQNGAVYLETNKKYDKYFGKLVLTYKTEDGKFLYFDKDDSVGGYSYLLPNNTDRFVIIKITVRGECFYKPVLLADDIPIVASHAQAPCCACVPEPAVGETSYYGTGG